MCWGANHRFFIRELDISGSKFTDAIMKNNKISYKKALKLKHKKGLDSLNNDSSKTDESEEPNDPLAIKVEEKTVFSNLADEMRKTLRYYMKTSNQAFFNKFHLTGGGASIPGLQKYIKDELNVELEIFNPFSDLVSLN